VPADAGLLRRTGLAPQVNLLPQGVVDRRKLRRQRVTLGGVAAAVLVVLVLAWYLELTRAGEAVQRAEAAEAAQQRLEAEKASLQRYADLQTGLNDLQSLRAGVFRSELRTSAVLQDFTQLLPDKLWLTQMTLHATSDASAGQGRTQTQTQTGGNTAVVPDNPGYGAPVATITFTGRAQGHRAVADFMRSLDGTVKKNGQPIYVNPYYTTSTQESTTRPDPDAEEIMTFTASVDVTAAGFSGRFQDTPSTTGGGG
jgi:Tfp pilus assembly protein PilN